MENVLSGANSSNQQLAYLKTLNDLSKTDPTKITFDPVADTMKQWDQTGRGLTTAGQVGIADHVTIGDYATIVAQSGVMRDILSGERVLGSPGRPEREAKRILVSMERLPEIFREMRSLKSACRIIGGNTPGAGT